MPKAERQAAIKKLEGVRKSHVVTYLTADRGLVHIPVAEEIVRILFRHLQAMGKVDKLDLFIYSRGGDTNTPWPLVSVCRQFAKEFNALVPYRAHSAATQISMGADHIVMGPLGELTQVDPSLRTEYTPPNPLQAGQTLLVSVEDLRGFFEFFYEHVKVTEPSLPTVIDLLRDKVHPLAVGQVHRAHGAIRYIAESLLGMHIKDQAKVKRISEAMVTEHYIHSHKIKQPEADRVGLPAVNATDAEAEAMWELFELYESDMQLQIPIRPSSAFADKLDQYAELNDQPMVYVESTARTDVFKIDVLMSRTLAGAPTKKVQLAPAPAVAAPIAPGGLPGVAAPLPAAPPAEQRPIWGPNLQITTEREWWSVE